MIDIAIISDPLFISALMTSVKGIIGRIGIEIRKIGLLRRIFYVDL